MFGLEDPTDVDHMGRMTKNQPKTVHTNVLV